jgi:flagellar biogenesis protein FliO
VSPVTQYVVQAAVTLLGIAVLAFLVVAANRRLGTAAGRGPLELLGRLPLEGRRAVYMVRVNSRVLVLAATDQQITKLADLPDEGDFVAPARASRFNDVFGRLTQRPAASPSGQAAAAPQPNETGERVSSSVPKASAPEIEE